jgi:hypothetical protein
MYSSFHSGSNTSRDTLSFRLGRQPAFCTLSFNSRQKTLLLHPILQLSAAFITADDSRLFGFVPGGISFFWRAWGSAFRRFVSISRCVSRFARHWFYPFSYSKRQVSTGLTSVMGSFVRLFGGFRWLSWSREIFVLATGNT